MDPSALLFFENLRVAPSPGTWIDQELLAQFESAASTGRWPASLSGCPLADLGNYLLRVLHVLATFARSLVTGDVISTHIDEGIPELVAENDLHTANFVDDKHAALRSIAGRVNEALKSCEDDWSFTLDTNQISPGQPPTDLVPPDHEIPPSFGDPFMTNPHEDTADLNAYDTVVSDLSSPGQNLGSSSWTGSSQVSPESTEEPTMDPPSMDQLKARGKGRYTCPHGATCNKGGVQSNGELTVYERNSAFRAHLQLHERMFKCDLPGCTNKKGFARIDQLVRHKSTARHDAPTDTFVNNAG